MLHIRCCYFSSGSSYVSEQNEQPGVKGAHLCANVLIDAHVVAMSEEAALARVLAVDQRFGALIDLIPHNAFYRENPAADHPRSRSRRKGAVDAGGGFDGGAGDPNAPLVDNGGRGKSASAKKRAKGGKTSASRRPPLSLSNSADGTDSAAPSGTSLRAPRREERKRKLREKIERLREERKADDAELRARRERKRQKRAEAAPPSAAPAASKPSLKAAPPSKGAAADGGTAKKRRNPARAAAEEERVSDARPSEEDRAHRAVARRAVQSVLRRTPSPSKPTHVAEDISFGAITGLDGREKKPTSEGGAEKARGGKKQRLQKALESVQREDRRSSLGNGEADEAKQKDKELKKLMDKASGVKVLDDERRIKKSLKRLEGDKKRSKRRWQERLNAQKTVQKARQSRRDENIEKRKAAIAAKRSSKKRR